MTVMGRASAEGLEKVAQEVLAPHFHQEPVVPRTVSAEWAHVGVGELWKATDTLRQFAIRPTLRNHTTLSRNTIIKQVAAAVGPGHKVDLNNYELLITVEVYQVRILYREDRKHPDMTVRYRANTPKNICGMSVVDNSFERLKRFNLAEIFEPTPKEVAAEVKEALSKPDAETDMNAGASVDAVSAGEPTTMSDADPHATSMDMS